MIPATDAQIEAVCVGRSATATSRALAEQGLAAGASRIDLIISRMIAEGRRERLPMYIPSPTNDQLAVTAFDAELGCKRLLEAQLRTGCHWIHDANRFADACREAGIAA